MPQTQHNSIYRRSSVSEFETGWLGSSSTEERPRSHRSRQHAQPSSLRHPPRNDDHSLWDLLIPHNPPPLAPPADVPPPSPEPGNGLPSDWWHHDRSVVIVNGTGDLWSGDRIPFFPDHSRCTEGVYMKHARMALGMLYPQTPLSQFIHPMLFHIPHPMLSITWPGYQSFQQDFSTPHGLQLLRFERPLSLHPDVMLRDLAQQVAKYFFEFADLYEHTCNPNDPRAILLGARGVTFDRLRMVKLYSKDGGLRWELEVAIVSYDVMLIPTPGS